LEAVKILEYSGAIQYDTIGELIHQFKNAIHRLGVQTGTYKKILLVMIESLENIMKYGGDHGRGDETGLLPAFSITKEKNHYTIATSNALEKRHMAQLETKLSYLNTLNQQGLKDFYKATITNGEFSKHGGAGLGLIEMAKISGNKIDYTFQPVNENYVSFNLRIKVDESSS
jgi:hypothetical protein